MTRFERPVAWEALLSSSEMQLRYPHEAEARVGSCNNEGEGSGFDLGSPRAYAERWFTTGDDAEQVLSWFDGRLSELGWSRDQQREGFQLFTRDEDERMGVTVFDSAVRIHMAVDGSWPDDTSGPPTE